MCICESWARSDDHVVISECTPPGYDCFSISCGSQNYGGGIAVIYKAPLKLSLTKIDLKPVCNSWSPITYIDRQVCKHFV